MKITDAIRDMFDGLTGWQRFAVVAFVLVAIFLLVFGGSAVSSWKISSLERDVAAYKERADAFENKANAKEKEAAKYSEKIVFLEDSLTKIQKLARTQDENLQNLSPVVADARANAERARGVRSIASTADELCKQLEATGHPCRE